MEQGQIDQNTNLSTLGHLYQPVHLGSRWPVKLLPHQFFENIVNLKVLDKLLFQRMITRTRVARAVLKHLYHLLTD